MGIGPVAAVAAPSPVELWRDCGDSVDAEGVGEWPEVYDMVLMGGDTAGVPVEEMLVWGDGRCAAETDA
jgi:hypothetical protein